MGRYDDPIGSVMISTWVCSMLEMLIIRDTIYYYTSYKKDSLALKAFVGTVVLVDFVSLISDYADVYLLSVKFWGNEVVLQEQYWPVPAYLATTGLVALLVQGFLIHRVWVLTKNWFALMILAFGALASFGGSMATSISFAIFRAYSDRYKGRIPVILWMSTTTATDVAITIVLILRLYGMKTSFKQTETLIYRLIRTSMQTGTTTCVVAIITLITYLVNNASNVETAFAFILGRVYVLTLLYNVNLRASHQEQPASQSQGESGAPPRNVGPNVSFGGIQVHRTAHVHMDEEEYALGTPSKKNANGASRNDADSDGESIVIKG
ncbi:hypothetical protein V5O48_006920 [Marasmius crinis-equi]|uniref:DUF6534 domain-containing protein n=1 Tax=Marasmius crinis-equi TaxID=585013 RepID=A0ABR3FIM8_9AGAR